MRRHSQSRRLISEINVVPYIDVMLVLLVIFMITAPLLTQGVKVDLPQASSEVLPPSDKEPLIISIDADGSYYIEFDEGSDKPVDTETMLTRVSALLRYQPGIPVLVRGDADVSYGRVVGLMTLLQSAGVDSVGLMTEPPDPG
tara:strand:- start:245 stop:673 length:429 start_codon:yes stop_codon:yes gene_type:complete